MRKIQAIILCAGLGSRLKPLTDATPKCMIKINGQPLLGWILDYLSEFNITNIGINMHYLPDQINEYIATRSEFKIDPNFETKLKGTAGALPPFNTGSRLEENFYVLNGDTIIEGVDLKEMMTFHKSHHGEATVFTNDTLVKNGGLFIFNKSILDIIPRGKMYSLHEELLPRMVALERPVIKYSPQGSSFIDIGTHAGLEEARKEYGD